MFELFRRDEIVEENPEFNIPKNLEYAIVNAKVRERIQGIDSNRLALISVEKKNEDIFEVGIEFERELDGETIIDKHNTLTESSEKARAFFSDYGLGEISWLPAAS